jgi:hypothetical protein
MILREANADDGPEIANLFLDTPIRSGTSFALDRRPDFFALPKLRGQFRTFVATLGERLAGTVTALWRPAHDGVDSITIGEIADLRVAQWARRGWVGFHLLRAAQGVFDAERVEWILCLIGKHNDSAAALTARRAGFPTLTPLDNFVSVHFVSLRLPRLARVAGVSVRQAGPSDAALLAEYWTVQRAAERFAPPDAVPWPDPTGCHRAWLAFGPDGAPCGALLVWDGAAVRRIQIARYRAADLPLRVATRVSAGLGFGAALPEAGHALRLWSSRMVVVRARAAETLRALTGAALSDAVDAGCNVLQLNLHSDDALLQLLPPFPRSTYGTTLYGGARVPATRIYDRSGARCYGDIARV